MSSIRIVQADIISDTSLSVHLSDGSTLEVTLPELLSFCYPIEPDEPTESNSEKWN